MKYYRLVQEYEGYIRFKYVEAESAQEAEQMGMRCADDVTAVEISKELYKRITA